MLLSPIKVYLITETSKNSIHRVFRGAFITLPCFGLPLRENFAEAADITQLSSLHLIQVILLYRNKYNRWPIRKWQLSSL